MLARLGQIPAAPLSGGLAALAQANQDAVARQAETDRRASAHATEVDRRKALLEAATASFSFIADAFLTAAAPSAEVPKGNQGGWTVRIDDAQLTLSGPRETAPEVWRTTSTPAPFDVIASATLSPKIPANYHGYEGRSHSLWYADAHRRPVPVVRDRLHGHPDAPHRENHGTLRAQSSPRVTRRRRPGDDDAPGGLALPPARHRGSGELISRWADWLAQAATGQLAHPSRMPERDPQGS
ncbi:hypothetical protein [Streptomyces umbrinus]|uniref:hypothetical protein n=1 Tax=Streptomyces umbrinus TaxID=67370 RepID=UPI003C2CB0F9